MEGSSGPSLPPARCPNRACPNLRGPKLRWSGRAGVLSRTSPSFKDPSSSCNTHPSSCQRLSRAQL